MIRLLVAIAVVAMLATPAFADDKQRAAVHDKQAKKYFESGQYDDAINEFQASYKLDPKPVTLFKIATSYYKKPDYKNAVDYYQKYLDVAPDGPLAQEAIDFSALAKKELAAEVARKAAEVEAARVEAERKQKEAEREQKRIAAQGHVKQAEAYGQAGAWTSAGDEYTAAAAAGDDPAYLLEAAKAYKKQPDNVKARGALLAYLEKNPSASNGEELRGEVATLTKAIDQSTVDEKERLRKQEEEREKARLAALGKAGSPARTYQVSYRKQTGGVDALGSTLVLLSFLDGDATTDPLFYVGTIIVVGATPGLHGLHGNAGRATLSVLMRVGIIGFGSVIANATGHTAYLDPGGFPYVAVPMVAWQIADSVLLSKQTKVVVEKPQTSLLVLPTHGGGTLGLAGQF